MKTELNCQTKKDVIILFKTNNPKLMKKMMLFLRKRVSFIESAQLPTNEDVLKLFVGSQGRSHISARFVAFNSVKILI